MAAPNCVTSSDLFPGLSDGVPASLSFPSRAEVTSCWELQAPLAMLMRGCGLTRARQVGAEGS